MSNPLVSIYIPTFNRLQLLRRAVDSVLNQTYEHFELIVVDDGSSDGTRAYLESLRDRCANVRVLLNAANQGACFSRNEAIEQARGEFVTGLDDDDYFAADRLRDFVDLWPERPAGVIALCSLRARLPSTQPFIVPPQPGTIVTSDLCLRNYVGSQVFVPTRLAREIGGFDTALPAWQDLEFALRLLSVGAIQCVYRTSYLVDATHASERISGQSFARIRQACDYIIEKHELTGENENRLRAQLLVYGLDPRVAAGCLARSAGYRDAPCAKAVIMRSYRALFEH